MATKPSAEADVGAVPLDWKHKRRADTQSAHLIVHLSCERFPCAQHFEWLPGPGSNQRQGG